MEYCHCGSLAAFIENGNRLNESELREIASCCLDCFTFTNPRSFTGYGVEELIER